MKIYDSRTSREIEVNSKIFHWKYYIMYGWLETDLVDFNR